MNTPAYGLPEILGLRPEHRLLDVGCGTGAIIRLLQKRVAFRCPPVGVDASRVMLRVGRRTLLRDPGEERPALLRGSAARLPFPPNTFDVVLSAHTVKYLSDEGLYAFLGEARRVLKPGGVLMLWEFQPRSSQLLNRLNRRVLTLGGAKRARLRTTWQLTSAASDCGFGRVQILRFGPFLWPPIPRLGMLIWKAEGDTRSP